jgi:hypothetical protein
MVLNVVLITLADMWDVVWAIMGPISLVLVVMELLFWSGLIGGGWLVWRKYTALKQEETLRSQSTHDEPVGPTFPVTP